MTRFPAGERVALLVVWVASVIYLGLGFDRGWIPHDEGQLGQCAERVLAGELPHRDFDDPYTGGLALIHALASHLFGLSLRTLRLVLVAGFVVWVPILYYAASRLVGPTAGALVALIGVAWSVPIYPASMPSWFNLYATVAGIAALCRYLDTGTPGWLFIAGVCGGVSFLFKSVGLYFIAAVLLFLIYREHRLARAAEGQRFDLAYRLLISGGLLTFEVCLVIVLWPRLGLPEALHFLLPGTALVGFLVATLARTATADSSRQRVARLLRLMVPFLLGVAVPVSLFLIPYISSASVGDVWHGVFVLPTKRLVSAGWSPPRFSTLLSLLPLALLARRPDGPAARRAVVAIVGAVLSAVLIVAYYNPATYRLVWGSMRSLITPLVLTGVWLLLRRAPGLVEERTFLLLAVSGLCALVQYPYAAPIYFCYIAPLAILAFAAIAQLRGIAARPLAAVVGMFYLAFAVFVVSPSALSALGVQHVPSTNTARLDMARSGLRISPWDREQYRRLIDLLAEHPEGDHILAVPDCPEVYFLSGRRNPTRTFYDFFDDPDGRTERLLATLEQRGVEVVVTMERVSFSGGLAEDLRAALEQRYPRAQSVGAFTVRWR